MSILYLHVHLPYMTFVREPCPLNPEILGLVTISNPRLRTSCSKHPMKENSPPSKNHRSVYHEISYHIVYKDIRPVLKLGLLHSFFAPEKHPLGSNEKSNELQS